MVFCLSNSIIRSTLVMQMVEAKDIMDLIPRTQGQLVAEVDTGAAIFRIYKGRIFHTIIKKGEKATMEIVRMGYDFLDQQGGGRYYNIYEFHSFADVDPEVRHWSARPTAKSYTIVDAIVITSLPQKILADFYLRYNKPINPTRVFYSLQSAFDWIDDIEKYEFHTN